MSKQPNSATLPTPKPQTKRFLVLITLDIADTAWRMFIPTVGSTIIGLVIDKRLGTTPWVMVVLMICGIAMAALLVRRQLQRIKSER